MTYRIRNIGIAVALALVAALLTMFYVSNYKRTVQQSEEPVKVYVAASDIPVGTSAEEIVEGDMLAESKIERRNVAPGAISNPKQLEGKVTKDAVYAGEQVSTLRFTTEEAKGIRSQITGNQRAFQLPGDRNQLLAGTLAAGDRVDVVGNWNVPESGTHHFTRVVLRDILVLRAAGNANGTTKLSQGPNAAPLSVMLAVTDSQAQKLFWVAKNGDWALQLRPTDDAADSPETAETAESLLLDGFKPNQLRAVMNAAERLLPKEKTDDE